MNTPKPQERYVIHYTVETQTALSSTSPPLIYQDTLFADTVVTVRHVYDGGSVRFSADTYVPHMLHLGSPACQVAAACQWEALNPRRLTPRKGDVWLLRRSLSDRTEAEVLYVYPDGEVCFTEPDGSETTCSPTFWEHLSPSLVGTYVPLFTIFGKGFGKKLVTA
jgi:hypothetical protein